MKRFLSLVAVLLLSVILCGCAELTPIDGVQLRDDLATYYERQSYGTNDGEERLILPHAPQVIEQTIDSRKKTAYIQCLARAVSEYQLFAREDLWELWYTYDRESESWKLTDKDYSGTEYELLSDLTQEQCASLMPIPDGQGITILSVNTERDAKTAAAVYTCQTATQYGKFGSVTMNAVVDASFAWQPDGGWQYTGSALSDATTYLGELDCYIGSDGEGMLDTERCTIGFDLLVFGDLVCIENLRYQGSICTLGKLHIGNVRLVGGGDGSPAVITFDYVRDVRDIQEDPNYSDFEEHQSFYRMVSGEGSITIALGEDGEYYAELFFGEFITNSDGNESNLLCVGIPFAQVKGVEEVKIEEPTPEPEPEPELESIPESEPEPEEPAKNWVGSWVCHSPEILGVDLRVEAELREDGTCRVVGRMMFGTLSRESTYYVVEDISQLPTDLLMAIMLGQTPTVAVVYDVQRDVLYICLEEGVYVYLSRADSGQTGGLYEP